MTSTNTFISDVFYFIKSKIVAQVTDPILSSRPSSSKFVLTSYPQINVVYPIVTIKLKNKNATRAGMQTTAMDVTMNIEIRIWARNEKEKDELYNQIYEVLRTTQFSANGSVNNDLHDFGEISSVEIDEEGEAGIKSRIGNFQYKFFNTT